MKGKVNFNIIIVSIAIIFAFTAALITLSIFPIESTPTVYAQYFSSTGGKQIFEAESGEISGDDWVIFQSRDCSSHRVLSAMDRFDGSATYTFESDNAVNAEMSLKMSYIGNEVCMRDVLSVTVNSAPVNLSPSAVYRTCSDYKTFFEFPIGTVEVQSGRNTITVKNIGGRFSLDYIAISPIVNYTGESLVIEAENATVAGSAYPQKRFGASGGMVLDNRTDGKIIFTVNSLTPALTSLTVRLGYSSGLEGSALSDTCDISVNGRSLANEIALDRNPSGEVDFYEYVAGNILLRTGENKIVLENHNYGVFYDCIALAERMDVAFGGDDLTIGAEDAACAGGSRVEKANDDKVIAFNSATTSAQFLIYCDNTQLVRLSLDFAYWGNCSTFDEVLFVTVNGYLLDLCEVAVTASTIESNDRYYDFNLYSLGNITLEAGYNLVSVTAIDSEYNIRNIVVRKQK